MRLAVGGLARVLRGIVRRSAIALGDHGHGLLSGIIVRVGLTWRALTRLLISSTSHYCHLAKQPHSLSDNLERRAFGILSVAESQWIADRGKLGGDNPSE